MSSSKQHHIELAKQLLLQRRGHDPEYKPRSALRRILSKKDAEPVFDYKEAHRAVLAVVSEDGDVGIVEALLNMGADVNIARHRSSKLWKRVMRMNQEDVRNDLLAQSVSVARPELVTFLADRADQISLDTAVGMAITRGDIKILEHLLQLEANPYDWHDAFLHTVANRREDIVSLMLSSRHLPCLDCRSKALATAVQYNLLESLQTLVKTGADVDFNKGEALQNAVDARNHECVTILVTGPSPPSKQSLDLAVSGIYHSMADPHDTRDMETLRLCLSKGAEGPNTNQLMVTVVQKGDFIVLKIIIENCKAPPVDYNDGAAIRHTIRTGQFDVLDNLLALRPSKATLAALVNAAMDVRDHKIRLEAVTRLLASGARGPNIANALVTAVQLVVDGGNSPDPDIVSLCRELLASADADVDFRNGQALQIAVKAAPENIMASILDKKPAMKSLRAALPIALRLKEKHIRLERTKMLMTSGVSGEVVDRGLISIVDSDPSDRELIETLLLRASVNFNQGEVFSHVINSKNLDILSLLLVKSPDQLATTTALKAALSLNGPVRHSFVGALLDFLEPDVMSFGLIELCQEAEVDITLIKVLVDAGAAVEYQGGTCLVHAASTFQLPLLEVLGSHVVDISLFSLAFATATTKNSEWLKSHNSPVLQYLIRHGAQGEAVSMAILHAATRFELPVLQTLTNDIGVNETLFTSVYSQVIKQGDSWLKLEHLDMVALLLKHGAAGTPLAASLILAANALATGKTPESLIDTLLEGGADVNYKNGEVIELAVGRGLLALLKKLLRAGATVESVSRAFPLAIQAGHSETLLLEMLDVFMDPDTAIPDVNAVYPAIDPPIHLCLQKYPDSSLVVTRLVDIGCDLEKTISHVVYPYDRRQTKMTNEHEARYGSHRGRNEGGEASSYNSSDENSAEPITALIWTIIQKDNIVPLDVIEVLISRRANISYTTPRTKTTALILAARYDKAELVARLINCGARVTEEDVDGHSALFYSARSGNGNMVASILKAKPRVNDGSLHEASRGFHCEVMRLLIASGHNPNFKSIHHGSRTALGELARHGNVLAHISDAEDAIEILRDNDSDPLILCLGKTVIFLAFENPYPLRMTEVLLQRLLSKTINHGANIFKDEDYYYSPTMYIAKKKSLGPAALYGNDLIQLLRDYGGTDVFYASAGKPQPDDATGMPPEIAEQEKIRREREHRLRIEREDHENDLRREKERVQQQHDIAKAEQEHQCKLQQLRRENEYLDAENEMKIALASTRNTDRIRRIDATWEDEKSEREQKKKHQERLADQEEARQRHQQLIAGRIDNNRVDLMFKEDTERQRLEMQHKAREDDHWDLERRAHIDYKRQKAVNRLEDVKRRRATSDELRRESVRAHINYRRDRALVGSEERRRSDATSNQLKRIGWYETDN